MFLDKAKFENDVLMFCINVTEYPVDFTAYITVYEVNLIILSCNWLFNVWI